MERERERSSILKRSGHVVEVRRTARQWNSPTKWWGYMYRYFAAHMRVPKLEGIHYLHDEGIGPMASDVAGICGTRAPMHMRTWPHADAIFQLQIRNRTSEHGGFVTTTDRFIRNWWVVSSIFNFRLCLQWWPPCELEEGSAGLSLEKCAGNGHTCLWTKWFPVTAIMNRPIETANRYLMERQNSCSPMFWPESGRIWGPKNIPYRPFKTCDLIPDLAVKLAGRPRLPLMAIYDPLICRMPSGALSKCITSPQWLCVFWP